MTNIDEATIATKLTDLLYLGLVEISGCDETGELLFRPTSLGSTYAALVVAFWGLS